MSQMCAILMCRRPSNAVCNCCQHSLCKTHIDEHYECLVSQLNPFDGELTALSEQLNAFNKHQAIVESREKLEQWRVECHLKIDDLFEKKCQELDKCITQKVNEQAEAVNQQRTKLTQLIRDQLISRQDINLLKLSTDRLQKVMDQIKETSIQINIRPLIITDTMLEITETFRPKNVDLLNLPPIYKTIDHSSRTSWVLTSNEKFLLIHQAPNLCLVNEDMKIMDQILWPFGKIHDMCWSVTLERFILINETDVFLVDENITLIEKIPTIETIKWLSCTCSDTSLFLSTNELCSSVVQFNLLPEIEFVKEWQSPLTCGKNEQIDSMVYNNGTLALMIKSSSSKSVRIELRFANTLDRLWSLKLDMKFDTKIIFHCCSLGFDEWLVTDYANNRLLHITKSGQVKAMITYPISPYHANLFNQNNLVVLTKHGQNLHRLV